MPGWGPSVFAIMIGVGIVGWFASLFLRPVPLVAEILSEVVSLTISVFTTYLMAVLYESQRWIVAPPRQSAPPACTPPAYSSPAYTPYAPGAIDPFAPPPSPYGPPPSSATASGSQPLVPWGPVPTGPTWSPTSQPGWSQAPYPAPAKPHLQPPDSNPLSPHS